MRLTFLLTFAFILVPSLAAAETYIVRPDGTGDFPTIAAAVEAAADGDLIILTNGTFTGPGNRDIYLLGKELTIRSQSDDPRRTVIDCERQSGGFWGEMFLRLEGVTVARGQNPFGGAIDLRRGTLDAVRCVFADNYASGYGGAVFIDAGAATFILCDFIGNVGDFGGAICT